MTKPERPLGLLAQLEQVRVEIERLAGMVPGAKVLMTDDELRDAFHSVIDAEGALHRVYQAVWLIRHERREASK